MVTAGAMRIVALAMTTGSVERMMERVPAALLEQVAEVQGLHRLEPEVRRLESSLAALDTPTRLGWRG